MTLPTPPTNLPCQITTFIGRDRELADLRQAIVETSLVTLIGPGGIGKTRLALETAAGLLREFPDGIWWVDLAGLTDPALVMQMIAASAAVGDGLEESPATVLVDALRPKKALLILDNCEHLVAACAATADQLLRGCPALRIMATSREPFGIAGERRWPVPPLEVPDSSDVPALRDLQGYGAIALFVERARLVCPSFVLDQRSAQAVVRLCRRLDGMPLAIELAAARLAVLTVEQIVARLEDRFRLLVGGSRTGLERHQALQACIDWSYEILGEAERAMFARLSVFAGSFSLAAAEAVCDDGAGTARRANTDQRVVDLLAQLVDKSMVVADTARLGEARYRLLDTLRQYARVQLTAHGDAERFLRRHAEYYFSLAEEASPALVGAAQVEWFQRLDQDHDNLRQSLRWFMTHQDTEAALLMVSNLWRFWGARGYLIEWGEWSAEVLRLPDVDTHPMLHGRILHALGDLATRQGDEHLARAHCEKSLAIQRANGDLAGAAWSLQVLGYVAAGPDAHREARLYANESMALRRTLDDQWALSHSLNQLAGLAVQDRDYPRALHLYEEGLAIRREVGDRVGIARSLEKLIHLLLLMDNPTTANVYLQEYAALRKAVGGVVIFTPALHDLTLDPDAPRLAGLQLLLEQELARQISMGEVLDATSTYALLGALALTTGDVSAARRHLARGLDLGGNGHLGTALILLLSAALAAAENDARSSVRLAAAGSGLVTARRARLPWGWNRWRERWLQPARQALGETLATAEWATGTAWPVEQAVTCARSLATPPETHGVAEPACPNGTDSTAGGFLYSADPPHSSPRFGGLTVRERQVAMLVARGLTNRQMAAELFISRTTAARHVEHILAKLGLRSRAQIAAWVTEQRLLVSTAAAVPT